MKILIITSLIAALLSCIKKNEFIIQLDKKDLEGKWVNTSFEIDTLFWFDNIIKRTDIITMQSKHSYTYDLHANNIKIKYSGEYYIAVTESSFKMFLNDKKNAITIIGIDNYYPKYKGNKFRKVLPIK